MAKTVDLKTYKGGREGNALLDGLNNLKANMEHQMELYELIAKCRKKYFDELVKEGFSEAQALEIITAEKI